MSRFGLITALAALFCAVSSGAQTVVFSDGFDPSINGNLWLSGPWRDLQNPPYFPGGHPFDGSDDHLHSTPNAGKQQVNYRVAYNMVHNLSSAYVGGVYLRGWVFEDNDIVPNPNGELEPNGFITLSNSNLMALPAPPGDDWYRIGVRGRYATITRPQWGFYLFVATKTDGPVLLTNWPRRQGWRKYTIEVYPYTGLAGDVQFYADDTLVYSGRRDPESFVDRIILGADIWTYETYWYDDIEFGYILPPTACATLAAAKLQPDGAWVEVTDKVVVGRYTKSPFAGWVAVEEPNRSAGLWVASSKEVNPGDRVSVRGRMASNSAGQRYLDAAEMSVLVSGGAPPGPLAANGRSLLAAPDLSGMCVKLWGRVTGRGQERRGDWRRYLIVDCPGLGVPLRAYYDNISSGVNPVPNPSNGDFVMLIGCVGDEVIETQNVRSLWIRGAGDLTILP